MGPRKKAVVLATSPFALGVAGLLLWAGHADNDTDGQALLWKAAVVAGFGVLTGRCVVLRTMLARYRAEVASTRRAASAAADAVAAAHRQLHELRAEVERLHRQEALVAMHRAAELLETGTHHRAGDTHPRLRIARGPAQGE